MQFLDNVHIDVASGRGGNGIVAGRREKYVEFGGPAGGNGGRGGDVVFQASADENTLLDFKYKKLFKAEDGEPGGQREKYGKDGKSLIILVPIGTVIKNADTGTVMHQFHQDKEQFIVAKGGNGGVGNMHFATSTLQFPQYALIGEPNHKLSLTLELQLLGDVALIGTPSVGKSTIINSVSKAKAQTAEYHFTTLTPNLGVVAVGDTNFHMVDIPGLIAGAADGKGLGNLFLRHVLKARVFSFVVDASRFESGMDDFPMLFDEIITYMKQRFIGSTEFGDVIEDIDIQIDYDGKFFIMRVYRIGEDGEKKLFLEKALCWVLNKYDLVNDEEIMQEYEKEMYPLIFDKLSPYLTGKLTQAEVEKMSFVISAATHHGVPAWLNMLHELLSMHDLQAVAKYDAVEVDDTAHTTQIADVTAEMLPVLIEEGYIGTTNEDGEVIPPDPDELPKIWRVQDETIARLTYMTMWGNDEGELWFWQTLQKDGDLQKLEKAGANFGDILQIVSPYLGHKDKFIQWE